MPHITLQTVHGKSPEALNATMREITEVVSRQLGYDPQHIWVTLDEVDDTKFMAAGQTWDALRPRLYPDG